MGIADWFASRPLAPAAAEALRRQRAASDDRAAAERREAADSRRETERRWYAGLPAIAIAALCAAVVGVTALLVLASLFVKPALPAPDTGSGSGSGKPPPPKPVSMQLRSKELFGYDSSRLQVVGGAAQRELDTCLKPTLTRIHVTGHADCIGSDRYNQALSERRAAAVKRYFEDQGVAAAVAITTQGQGAALARTAQPLCATAPRPTAANQARLEAFRRVDVSCEFAAGTLAQASLRPDEWASRRFRPPAAG